MQLDAILEVAIGLVFVWLVISVATMEIQNRIGAWFNWRAEYLEQAIHNMFKDKDMVERFYNHPLILELSLKDKNGGLIKDKKGKVKRPDYIPNPTFATAAFEVIMNAGKGEKDVPVDMLSMTQMKDNMKALWQKNLALASVTHYLYPNMEKDMQAADAKLEQFENKVAEYRKNTEAWFNDVMSQASQWYKLRAQWIAFWIGLGIAIVMNVDSIQVAQKLWLEPSTRAIIVAQAEAQAQSGEPASSALEAINFPVGWTTKKLETNLCGGISVIDYQLVFRSAGECRAVTGLPNLNNFWGILVKLVGYFLSAFAAAQGAPFWFDVLRKLVNVKQASKENQ
ncbi:MAG: hypothetical protein IT311_08085 [Anaerolineales bacterium]|nr:hypothetical protein [Anaerolineales bacterium]MCZ2122297.1 hypothetical protein [Anaerolineales bacterium]